MKIVGLCGSLRKGSVNGAALRLASELMPEGVTFELATWRDVPIYDDDLKEAAIPAAVTALAGAIRASDGVLIACPEYNFSIPGGFKNALDWVSRVPEPPFENKPVALMSAAPGPVGGARMQYDLRKVLLSLRAMPLTKPEVFIVNCRSKFDETGLCTDEPTRKFVGDQIQAFESWIGWVVGAARSGGHRT